MQWFLSFLRPDVFPFFILIPKLFRGMVPAPVVAQKEVMVSLYFTSYILIYIGRNVIQAVLYSVKSLVCTQDMYVVLSRDTAHRVGCSTLVLLAGSCGYITCRMFARVN